MAIEKAMWNVVLSYMVLSAEMQAVFIGNAIAIAAF